MNRYYKVRDSIGLQNWAPLDCKNWALLACKIGAPLHQDFTPFLCAKINARSILCADCELPMYLKYLQQDESQRDYLITKCSF